MLYTRKHMMSSTETCQRSVSSHCTSQCERGGTPTSQCERGGTPTSQCERGGTPTSQCEREGTLISQCETEETPTSQCERGGTPNMADHTSAQEELLHRALCWSCDITSLDFAKKMDASDSLRQFRNKFHYPKNEFLPYVDLGLVDAEDECVYLCGNSLGLQPRYVQDFITEELDKWAKLGVHGHRHGNLPWAFCDEKLVDMMAPIVGAKPSEVALANALTVNIHLFMISFYQPTKARHKILIESKAFPSDHYAVESQIRLRGYDPAESMVCVSPRQGENCLRDEDILRIIEEQGEEIALVLFPSVQYYTGQCFDMKAITHAAHKKGCWVGLDLAHAVGNVELHLHDWAVDFAAWCTYKYLNSGAGGIGGMFLHEKHRDKKLQKLQGWWGHRIETRFDMSNVMEESPGIDGYRISNPSMFLAASLKASLKVFSETSMQEVRSKSRLLTGYLEYLLQQTFSGKDQESGGVLVDILTPADEAARGAQLSVAFSVPITKVFQELARRGVVCDKREPSVLRFAPAPLYNSFQDVHKFVTLLKQSLAVAREHSTSHK